MSRYVLAVAALTATLLLAGCTEDDPPSIPLGTAADLPGDTGVTPHEVWVGKPGDLASVTVRHPDGSRKPPPSGTPYYVPTSVSGEKGTAASELLRAVDGDGKEVAPLDEPFWNPGTDPCEHFTFRQGDTPYRIDDDCVVFVLPPDAELDYLVTAESSGERVAWPVRSTGSPPPSPTPSPTVRTEDEACGGSPFNARAVRAYSPSAAPYAGPGIHPMQLFTPDFFGADGGPQLPTEWESREPNRVQLVVCEYRDRSFPDRKIETCTYVGGLTRPSKAEVRTARYIYRVFEARTGRLVTTFTLTGTTDAAKLCPDETYAPARVYWQRVTSDALADRLAPLATGEVPAR